jgi:hypothetical protein
MKQKIKTLVIIALIAFVCGFCLSLCRIGNLPAVHLNIMF